MPLEQLGDQFAVRPGDGMHGQHAADDARALGGGTGAPHDNGQQQPHSSCTNTACHFQHVLTESQHFCHLSMQSRGLAVRRAVHVSLPGCRQDTSATVANHLLKLQPIGAQCQAGKPRGSLGNTYEIQADLNQQTHL